jgi:hypothetical protein
MKTFVALLPPFVAMYVYLVARELDARFGSAMAPRERSVWMIAALRALRSLGIFLLVVGLALILVSLFYFAGAFR